MKKFIFSQKNRVYDLIFPFFSLWLFPPLTLVVLIGNFIVDGIIIFIVFKAFKIKIKQPQWAFLTKMWLLGLLVDMIGSIILMVLNLPDQYVIWNNLRTASIFLIVVLACGLLLGFSNWFFSKRSFLTPKMAVWMGLSMGILTAPWTFLIPTMGG